MVTERMGRRRGSEQTDPRERKGLDQEQRMSGWRGSHSPLGMQHPLRVRKHGSGPV